MREVRGMQRKGGDREIKRIGEIMEKMRFSERRGEVESEEKQEREK